MSDHHFKSYKYKFSKLKFKNFKKVNNGSFYHLRSFLPFCYSKLSVLAQKTQELYVKFEKNKWIKIKQI